MYQLIYTAPNDYLMHHGIKGQKWGIRRYQNSDGSLTEEGKKKYGYYTKSGKERKYYSISDATSRSRKLRKELFKEYKKENEFATKSEKKEAKKEIKKAVQELENEVIRNKSSQMIKSAVLYEAGYALGSTAASAITAKVLSDTTGIQFKPDVQKILTNTAVSSAVLGGTLAYKMKKAEVY